MRRYQIFAMAICRLSAAGFRLDQEPEPVAHLWIRLRKAVRTPLAVWRGILRRLVSYRPYTSRGLILVAMKGGGTDGLRTRRTALTPLGSPIRLSIGDGGDDPRGVAT
jgi:hypothetical protein